jgi:long-subunit fatty acid transport protein
MWHTKGDKVKTLVTKSPAVWVFMVFILSNFVCTTNVIFAAGVILDSMGATSAGRGGANIAHTDNGILIHDNPAALINMPAGMQLDASLEFIYPEVRYRDPHNIDHSKHEIFILPSFSLVYKPNEESKFAFGVGAFIPAGFSTEYHLNHTIPSFGKQLYRSEASLMKILLSTSYRVNKKLSIGLSIGPAFHKVEFETPYSFQTGAFAGTAVLADFESDDIGFSYTLGIQYKFLEKTIIGLTYVSESKATLRGDAQITLPAGAPGSALFTNLGAEYDLKSNFEWPRSIGFGISHQLGMSHRLSSDVVWFNWASAYDRIHFKLTEGDNAEFNGVFGPIVNDVFPLDWNDTFALRFGYEYFYKGKEDDIFRFGYIFNENPIPHSTLTPLIPAILKHNFTFGYSHKWENWGINSAFEYVISDKEFVDTGIIIGNDFDNSSVKAKAYALTIGITYRH